MFEKIYGHEKEKSFLESAIKENRVSHAYLFYGPSGIGKKMLAFELAKTILETDKLETCPDFKYIAKKEEKKDIIVEQVREFLTDDVIERPISGKKKIYIIDDANLLNVSAQNAILKTLEEPPEYAVIILITPNLSSFLPTILSRVSKIQFSPLESTEVDEYIIKNGININENIKEFAFGSIGNINEIISKNLIEPFEKIEELIDIIEKKDISIALIKSSDIDFNELKNLEFLEFMLYKRSYFKACLEIKKAISRLKTNGNYDIVIDNMIIRCIEEV